MTKHKSKNRSKRTRFKPARFLPGRGVPWHGGMPPLPPRTKKTAPSVASAESGKAEQNLTGTVSASSVTHDEEGFQV